MLQFCVSQHKIKKAYELHGIKLKICEPFLTLWWCKAAIGALGAPTDSS